MLLLGEVDDLEIEGEGVREPFPGRGIQPVETLGDAAGGCRVARAPESDEVPARLLHEGEERRPALLRDDLAEERAEEADLTSERVLRPRAADAARLPPNGRVGPGASACYCGWARTMIRISVMSSMA
jgi:hypothetical protein